MGVQNYAMHTVYDLWTRKVSMEPKSNIVAATAIGLDAATTITNTLYTDEGVEVQLTPLRLTCEVFMMEHDFTETKKAKAKAVRASL